MQLLKSALLFVVCCLVMTSCTPGETQQNPPQLRIVRGMSREVAVMKLSDAHKHYECAGYEGAMDDLFLYGATSLEEATVVYLKSKMVSDTLTVYDFGIAENYLLPAAYGDCLNLSDNDRSQ